MNLPRHTFILTVLPLAATWAASLSLSAEPLSYFRRHGGVSDDEKLALPDRFEKGKGSVWRQELGPGHSTPCIHGKHIFLTTFEEKELATVALDRATGKVLWRQVAPAKDLEKVHESGSPAACTPACDGERVYSFFGSYGLLCYDLKGDLKWSRRLGPFQDEFGANSSPVLADGKVILNQDHDIGSFLLALDAKTGEVAWRMEREGFTRSYATPVVWEADGRKEIVVAGALRLVAYDPANGSERWWVDGLARIVNPTPVVADGLLYVSGWTPGGDEGERIRMEPWDEATKTWDKNSDGKLTRDELPPGEVSSRFYRIDLNQDSSIDRGEWEKYARVFDLAQNGALAIRPGGAGDVTKTHVVWEYRKGVPFVPSPVVYRGVVYLVRDGGIITALDAKSGAVLKQGRAGSAGKYYASPAAGDGKVYLASEPGVITVLRAGNDWEILSTHDLGERVTATPVITGGTIYLRTERALYAFGAEETRS